MIAGEDPAAAGEGGWTCPAPLPAPDHVLLGHGSGGRQSAALLGDVLLPALGSAGPTRPLQDAARFTVAPDGDRGSDGSDDGPAGAGAVELALTTDSFVVRPLFFPGGDIGSLSVHGTVNDLAMVGAVPVALSLALVVEEGFPLDDLRRVTASVAAAARRVGVSVAAGDTKVVERGAADGLFVTTTGVGRRLPGTRIDACRGAPGDAVLLSGPLARHGMAVLSCREGLGFDAEITSDSQPLHDLVRAMVAVADIHALRDPTRGGLASACNELAAASGVGIELDEAALPVPEPVEAACELLGLDPLHVANEGCLVALVPAGAVDAVLAAMRGRPEGVGAVHIGTVVADHPGRVTVRSGLGGQRVLDLLPGEQLPRIC